MKDKEIKTGFPCNNSCKFCPYNWKTKRNSNKSIQQIKKELKEARWNFNGVIFSGGEPPIREDIFELVSWAKKLGFRRIGIKSNGRMFAYKGFCQKIINSGANSFIISLHGHLKKLHDWLTSSPGSFEQTIQGIRNLKLLNQKVFSETVITKPNYRHLPQIAEFLIKLKVDHLQFKFPQPTGKALENSDSIMPKIPLVKPYLKEVLKIGKKANKIITLP
jgi:cyclic pyranopterin phosphate synthase